MVEIGQEEEIVKKPATEAEAEQQERKKAKQAKRNAVERERKKRKQQQAQQANPENPDDGDEHVINGNDCEKNAGYEASTEAGSGVQ